MPLRNWWGILCCGITGSDSGFQAQSWHKQSYIMVPHMLTPSPPCLSLPPPNLCFALFSVKSTLSWILCQGNICVLCIPSSKEFVMITTQLITSFHGLFCHPVTLLTMEQIFVSLTVSVMYMKGPASLMIPTDSPDLSSFWSSLQGHHFSAWKNLRKPYLSTDCSFFSLMLQPFFLS